MSEAGLERAYRRLLACYPRDFRGEQEDEMLGVLMASARDGQRRPGLPDTLDVLRGALRMRVRALGSGPENRSWADGLALFSVLAPVFLVLATAAEAAFWSVRLRFTPVPGFALVNQHYAATPRFDRVYLQNPAFGVAQLRLMLLTVPPLIDSTAFRIALISQTVVAVLVLLGMRRLALLAIAGAVAYWITARYWIPYPLQLLSTSVWVLEAAALTLSPGPKRGRHLLRWGHGAVLLLITAAVQASTMCYLYEGTALQGDQIVHPHSTGLLVTGLVLTALAVGVAVAVRASGYLLLWLALACYPYVLQVAFPADNSSGGLIANPTPLHLAALYGPPVLLVAGAIAFGLWRLRRGSQAPADAAKPA
ncbi:MAG TPA: hypothetical protein VGH27_25885 [Streptosporangiaceae bacterium]|jgi:hypothetical protein